MIFMNDKQLLEETHHTVIEIKEYISANSVKVESFERRLECHSQEIKTLEAYKNQALGIVAVLALVFGLIGAIISKILNIH